MELITGAKLAELLGVSRKTVAAAFHKGWITAAGENGRGPLYNPDEAVPQYQARGDRQKYLSRHRPGRKTGGRPARKGKPAKSFEDGIDDIPDIPEAGQFGEGFDLDDILRGLKDMTPAERLDRADLAVKIARARLGALEVRKREMQLIPVERVRDEGAKLAAQVLGALSPIPGRLAQQFSAMTDANAIHEMLEVEINRAIMLARDGVTFEETVTDGGCAGEE